MEKRKWAKILIQNNKAGAGIDITVRALPEIEQFMKNLGRGRKDPIESYGGMWIKPDERSLDVYALAQGLSEDRVNYTIAYPGREIILDDDVVNISFLRLAGISEGTGVTFTLAGVMSAKERIDLRNKFSRAVRQFCLDYITPTKVSVVIEGNELKS